MTVSLFGYLLMYNFEQFLRLSQLYFCQLSTNKIFLIQFIKTIVQFFFIRMFVWCFLSEGDSGFEKGFQIGF